MCDMSNLAYGAVKLSEKVYWVGAVDWGSRDFHGYLTSRGTTYNAYLVMGEKVTLIDAVKRPYGAEMFARIASVIDPEKIDYIVSNHSEPDHSGELETAIDIIKPEKVFASVMGAKALNAHYGMEDITVVKDGDELDLGGLTLAFTETRMLHWPDSMFSFLKEEGILFSQDAFGMHLASGHRFADEEEHDVLRDEAEKYYANILLPFSALVGKLVAKVAASGMDIRVVAPDHGPIYRRKQDIDWIIGQYALWSEQKPRLKASIVYSTMWQASEKMAKAILEGVNSEGVEPVLLPLNCSHRSDVATQVMDSGALIVGSPTINSNMFPAMADVLSYLKGLKPKNKIGGVFGSYGWSGEAVGQIEAIFDEMKIARPAESVKVLYVPTTDDLERCIELGRTIARTLKAKVAQQ